MSSKRDVGDIHMEERKREFIYLRQGRMILAEYERKFIRLSRYTRDYSYRGGKM